MTGSIRMGLLGAFLALPVLMTMFTFTTGCGGGDDECLVDGENCSSSYIEENYGDGRGCCDGMTCSEGTSGVLICQ